MRKQPDWFDDSPKWFQKFYSNDFSHFARDCEWMKKLILIALVLIVGDYFIG